MPITISCLFLYTIILVGNGLVIPRNNEGSSKRVVESKLSDEEHYKKNEVHNVDYDHEAFLGENEAQAFDELSPEESKRRLAKMVDKIDVNKDGFVTTEELKNWIQLTQKRYIITDTERQWKGLNPLEENEISWDTYRKLTYGSPDDNVSDGNEYNYRDMVERDHRRWKRADVDQNGYLNKIEFTDFIHPEESSHMKDIVILETIEDIDKNKDGKISMDEYIGDMFSDEDDVEEEPSWVQSEREQFEVRDKDKSGFMEFDEVKDWIIPTDYDNSEAEAKHLVYESDVNRDNMLSKEEILNKYELFVGSHATDFGDALTSHDEF